MSNPLRHAFLGACASCLLAATAAAQQISLSEAPAEARALWVSRFEYGSADGVARIVRTAAHANFNIIYFQVRGAGDALYRSELEPCAALLCGRLGGTPRYDPLEVAVREAHRHGIQLHAWLNALPGFPAGGRAVCSTLDRIASTGPRHILQEHPELIMRDRRGRALPCPNSEEYLWMSPAYGIVRTRLARVAADIARRYDVDGIHLDRIRYPGADWSYDDASLGAFGASPSNDPEGWSRFRTSLINAMVRETFDSLRAVRPDVVLSAAVWGVYEDRWGWRTTGGATQLFQDPHEWARDGYLDVAVPMTYFRIREQYCARADWACLLDDHLAGVQESAGRHVYIGIDAGKGAAEVIRQIRLARAHGAVGVSIYSFSAALRAGLFQELSESVFARTAPVPLMPWRSTLSHQPGDAAERH